MTSLDPLLCTAVGVVNWSQGVQQIHAYEHGIGAALYKAPLMQGQEERKWCSQYDAIETVVLSHHLLPLT